MKKKYEKPSLAITKFSNYENTNVDARSALAYTAGTVAPEYGRNGITKVNLSNLHK